MIRENDDDDRYARAAFHAYHKATKDWEMIPYWGNPKCLQDGWRAAAGAVLGLAAGKREQDGRHRHDAMTNFPTRWSPKYMIEVLCSQEVYVPDDFTRFAMAEFCSILALHRPTGSDGKHGDLHTPTCGCE